MVDGGETDLSTDSLLTFYCKLILNMPKCIYKSLQSFSYEIILKLLA